MTHQRLRILVSAFACSPFRGSEPGIGWNVVTRLANYHDVTVLVGDLRKDLLCKRELDEWLASNGPKPGLTFCHVGPDRAIQIWERLHRLPGLWPLYYRAYGIWQKRALHLARSMHANRRFDAVHELTYQSARTPGYLWKLGVPFFWGPISGAPVIPPAFYGMFGWSGSFRPLSRDLLNRVQLKLGGSVARIARRARRVFVATPEDELHARSRWYICPELLPASGSDPTIHGSLHRREPGRPVRIVWSGRMVARKALPLLLNALARLPVQSDWTLAVLGDGPMRIDWQKKAKRLGLSAERIRWHGRLDLAQAKTEMSRCDLLVHTALTEGTPNVVLEGLSFGLPVICHDVCGMSLVVTDTCGIKVPLVSPELSISGFGCAIRSFFDKPDLLAQFSESALLRSKELTWDSIAMRISEAYTNAAEELQSR